MDHLKKRCPYCSEEILIEAKKCKHCGEYLDQSLRNTNTLQKKKSGCIANTIWGITGLIVLALIISIFTSKSSPHVADKYLAYVMMKDFAKDGLKAPSTAEFEPISTIGVLQDGNVWKFNGYVDSQNSFGAKLRTKFSISIEYNPDKDTWSLLNMSFK